VRSIVILLVPAILATRVFDRLLSRDRATTWIRFAATRLLVVALLPFAVQLPWSLRNAAVASPEPAQHTYLHSYGVAMWHQDPADPASPRITAADVGERLRARTREIAQTLGGRMQDPIPYRGRMLVEVQDDEVEPAAPGPARYAIAIVVVLALLVVWVRRREPAEIFCLLVLALVAVYFGFNDRILLPVAAFGLAALADVVHGTVRRFAGARAATVVIAAALLALLVVDFGPRRDWDRIERRHQAYRALADTIERRVAPGDTLATMAGSNFEVFLERPVFNLRYAQRREGFPAVVALIEKYGIDVVFLTPRVSIDRNPLQAFRSRYGAPEPDESVFFFRVR
jgi:hypothetical protein